MTPYLRVQATLLEAVLGPKILLINGAPAYPCLLQHSTECVMLSREGWVVVFVAGYFSSTDVSMSFVQLAITIARC